MVHGAIGYQFTSTSAYGTRHCCTNEHPARAQHRVYHRRHGLHQRLELCKLTYVGNAYTTVINNNTRSNDYYI